MKPARRALLAVVTLGVVAGALRRKGPGAKPAQQGGWRELSGPDLR